MLRAVRSTPVAEANGRAAIDLATLSGSVVALAFVGQASALGTALPTLALTLLPVVGFVGMVTRLRLVPASIEDIEYAHRIGPLRAYYIRAAPEIRPHLVVVASKVKVLRLGGGGQSSSSGQLMLTVVGMVGVHDSVVFGATAAVALQMIAAQTQQARVLCGAIVRASVRALHYCSNRRTREDPALDRSTCSRAARLLSCPICGTPGLRRTLGKP